MPPRGKPKTLLFKQNLKTKTFQQFLVKRQGQGSSQEHSEP